MAIIKLHECYLIDSDQMRDVFNKIPWSRWIEKEIYVNTNYIIKFKECHHASKTLQEYALNKENFHSLLWICGEEKDYYRIKETPKQIMKLIEENENDK